MKKYLVAVISLAIVVSTFSVAAQQNKTDGAPKVGDVAPLFKLDLKFNDFANEKSIDLNTQVGDQPIVLIFGSYT